MSDLEWLRSLANWASLHIVILLLSLSVACLLGLLAGARWFSYDGDTEADRAIRARVAANREKRAARVHCNCIDPEDEHAEHLGAA